MLCNTLLCPGSHPQQKCTWPLRSGVQSTTTMCLTELPESCSTSWFILKDPFAGHPISKFIGRSLSYLGLFYPQLQLLPSCVLAYRASQDGSGKEPTCQCRIHESRLPFLGREDSLEEGMATHSSFLACTILWTEEPGRLQSIGSDTTEAT